MRATAVWSGLTLAACGLTERAGTGETEPSGGRVDAGSSGGLDGLGAGDADLAAGGASSHPPDAATVSDAGVDAADGSVPESTDASSGSDASNTGPDATAGSPCCIDDVTSDCSPDCVPRDALFTRVFPCEPEAGCATSATFDGEVATIGRDLGDEAFVYHCHGDTVLDANGAVLGRFDRAHDLLWFEETSFCASSACRALWDSDGCASLFEGTWVSQSRGCMIDDEFFGPTGCPHALTFEEQDPLGPGSPPLGPACIWWGDDFVISAPLSCTDNRGTCGADALELHPTVGILYQGAWHPEGLSPCDDTLVGTWVSTECGGCDGGACTVTLDVSTDGRAVIASDVSLSGDIACEGTSFVFFADGLTPPPDDAWAAGGYASGDIAWTTDSLTMTWNQRTLHFVRR